MSVVFMGRVLFGLKPVFFQRPSGIPAHVRMAATPSAPIGPLADNRSYADAKVHFAAQPTVFRQVRKKDKTMLERISSQTLKALYGNKTWGEPKLRAGMGSFHTVG